MNQVSHRGVVLAEHVHHVLGLDGLRKGREATQVGEHDGDLPPVALEEGMVARGHDQVGKLRREEAAQPAEPLQLVDLLLHAPLELLVERRQLRP